MNLDLSGRTALITGASKGIGFAAAQGLADEGCNLILVSRTAEDLEAARGRIVERSKVDVQTRAVDLSVGTSASALAREFPEIDILVNNAGAIPGGKLEDIDEARWRTAWDLKVFGYINLTRICFEQMKTRGRGVIINIIGAAGDKVDANYIAGSTGNASLMAFTRALGGAAPEHGLRVVGINPGPVQTERLITSFRKRAQESLGDPERWREMGKAMPFGRPAKPEEIGAMVAFLASDLAGYISGTVVTIDGGRANRPG
ncbi:MAG: short-chain dehydrogenase/reductase [Variovorax sp.]